MIVTRDAIAGFAGSWNSGLAALVFQSGASVWANNGPLARALDELGADLSNHCVDCSPITGTEIVYWLDDFGLTLGGFVLYEDWIDRCLPVLEPGEPTIFNPEEYQA